MGAPATGADGGTLATRTALVLALICGTLALANHVVLPWLALTLSRRRFAIASLGLTGLRHLEWLGDHAPILRIARVYVTVSPMWLFRWGPVGSKTSATRPITIAIDGVEVRPGALPRRAAHAPAQAPAPAPRPLPPALARLRRYAFLAAHYALPFVTAFFGVEVRNVLICTPELGVETRIAHAQLRADATLAYANPQMRALATMFLEERSDDFAPAASPRARPSLALLSGRARITLAVAGVEAVGTDRVPLVRSRDSVTLCLYAPIGHYTMRESIHATLRMAESVVNVPAVLAVHAAAKAAKAPPSSPPPSPPSPPPAARLLAMLGSLDMSLPMLRIIGMLPDSTLALHGELRNLHFFLANSDLNHFVHQSWFGACGVRGHQSRRSSLVPILEEWRRIFYLRAGFSDASAHCVDTRTGLESLLLHIATADAWARSSYTPFGMYPVKEHADAPLFLEQDPNEHAIATSLTLGHVRGAVLAEHAAMLSGVLARVRAQAPPPPARAPRAPLTRFPRVAFLIAVPRAVYVVHDDVETMGTDSDAALVVGVQDVSLRAKTQYVERGLAAPTPLAFEGIAAVHVEDFDVYASMRCTSGVAHLDILHVHDVEAGIAGAAPVDLDAHGTTYLHPTPVSDVDIQVALVEVDMWHPVVIALLTRLAARFAPMRTHGPPKNTRTPLHAVPTCSAVLSIAHTTVFIGGSDPEYDPETSKGLCIVLRTASARFDRARPPGTPVTPSSAYTTPAAVAAARTALGLAPDVHTHTPDAPARASLHLHGLSVYPLVDIGSATPHYEPHKSPSAWMGTDRSTPHPTEPLSVYARGGWGFDSSFALCRAPRAMCKLRQMDPDTFVADAPHIGVHLALHTDTPAADVRVVADRLIRYRVQLMHLYCVLIALGTVRRLAESAKPPPPPAPAPPTAPPPLPPRRTVAASVHIADAHISLVLPNGHDMLVVVHRVDVSTRPDVRISVKRVRAFVHSAQAAHKWELLAELRAMLATIASGRITLVGDCLQVQIPFGYYTHGIVEGALVLIKASKQLVHQLVRRRHGSAMFPTAEDAKRLPPIALRLRVISLEAADEQFESALALLLRVGRDEQLARLERDALFAAHTAQRSPTLGATAHSDPRGRLDRYNASLWIRRMHNARLQEEAAERDVLAYIFRQHIPRSDHGADGDLPIAVIPRPHQPPLARALFVQAAIDISPPAGFALADTHRWLHEQSGPPVDTQYTVLVPFHLRWRMSEATITLRNYPIPILGVPPLSSGQPLELANWSAEGDLCVAEQLGTKASIRYVPATVVPAVASTNRAEHGMLVPKNAVAKKFFGELHVRINTHATTVLAWGHSIQPAIQALMRVVDALTSPPHDPSPRLGQWDKLPLALQARIRISFAGDVQLFLRGSRDPFLVTGIAAGWAMIWESPAELRLMYPNADGEMVQVSSAGHVLAVPDLTQLPPLGSGLTAEAPSLLPGYPVLHRAELLRPLRLSKVAWRLAGHVHWGLGMLSERTCRDDTCPRDPPCRGPAFHRRCRWFGRRPHWEVMGRTREGLAALPPAERRDTFEGWRSDYVHLALSIESVNPDGRANHLYVTPNAWGHFLAWLRLFNSRLSLPVRQGRVFPQITSAKKPKFGQHLATIKYRFNIEPLVATHTYHQLLKHDLCHGIRTHVGVRAHVGVIGLDIHQRMEESVYRRREQVIRSFHKPLYELEAEVRDICMHVLGARFSEPWGPMPELAAERERYDLFGDLFTHAVDATREPLYDPDDFVELGLVPSRTVPRMVAHEFMRCPRINLRRIMRPNDIRRPRTPVAPHPESKFGVEPSHRCIIDHARHKHVAKVGALEEQLAALDRELAQRPDPALAERRAALARLLDTTLPWSDAKDGEWSRLIDEWDHFVDHLYIVEPVVLVHDGIWSLIERYIVSVRLQARLMKQLNACMQRDMFELARANTAGLAEQPTTDDVSSVLRDLADGIGAMATGGAPIPTDYDKFGREDDESFAPDTAIADAYAVHRGVIAVCERPQIILHSSVDDATVVCHATLVRSRTYAVSDVIASGTAKTRELLHRSYVTLHALKCFHVARPAGAPARPATLATLALSHDALNAPVCGSLVSQTVPSTDTYIHFDKHNKMYPRVGTRPLVAPDAADTFVGTHLRDHTDWLQISTRQLTLRANKEQYAALYSIVTRVLLHRDPMEHEQSKRLDTLLYSHTFEDPELVAQAVTKLQRNIHRLINRQGIYCTAYDRLNTHGRREYVRTQLDLCALLEELTLVSVAVSMVGNHRAKERHLALQIQVYAQQIEWMMIRSHEDHLFARLALDRVALTRLNLSNFTSMTAFAIGDVLARNAHPSAYFEDIIGRYTPPAGTPIPRNLFASASWLLHAPVGGISVMDYFELYIHPVRVQLELRVGHQFMDYLFGSQRSKKKRTRRTLFRRTHGEASPESDMSEPLSPVHVLQSPPLRPLAPQSDSSDELSDEWDATLQSPTDAELRPTRARGRPDEDTRYSIILDSIVREMARRAAANSAFIRVVILSTHVCLSFKGESDLVGGLTDLFDLKFVMPRFQYLNVVGSFGDIADLLKKDLIRVAWNNRSMLLKGVMNTNAKKRAALRRIRAYRQRHYGQLEMLDPENQLELLANDPRDHDVDSDADSVASLPEPGLYTQLPPRDAPSDAPHDLPRDSPRRLTLKRLVPDRILQLRKGR